MITSLWKITSAWLICCNWYSAGGMMLGHPSVLILKTWDACNSSSAASMDSATIHFWLVVCTKSNSNECLIVHWTENVLSCTIHWSQLETTQWQHLVGRPRKVLTDNNSTEELPVWVRTTSRRSADARAWSWSPACAHPSTVRKDICSSKQIGLDACTLRAVHSQGTQTCHSQLYHNHHVRNLTCRGSREPPTVVFSYQERTRQKINKCKASWGVGEVITHQHPPEEVNLTSGTWWRSKEPATLSVALLPGLGS